MRLGVAKPPLLVLGASEDQVPLYREARRCGLPTVAVDARPDRPALPLATRFLRISTRDHEAIATALGPVQLAGVVTMASDACLASVHELARRYHTAEIVTRAALRPSMDKVAFHDVAARAGVPRYGWVAGSDVAELLDAADSLVYPLVAKPTDASGSRGATLVAGPDDLPAAVMAAQDESPSGSVLVEEFVAGRALTVELLLAGGRPLLAAASERRLAPGPGFVTERHSCPARLGEGVRRRLIECALRVALAMGTTDGAVDLDFVLARDGTPYVLEAGARLGGNGLAYVLRVAFGVDAVAAVVAQARGEQAVVAPGRPRHAILHVFGSPLAVDGTLGDVEGVDDVRDLPGVEVLELFARPGDAIHPFVHSGHKFGYLAVSGETASDAEETLQLALERLSIVVEPESHVRAVPEPELVTAAIVPAAQEAHAAA